MWFCRGGLCTCKSLITSLNFIMSLHNSEIRPAFSCSVFIQNSCLMSLSYLSCYGKDLLGSSEFLTKKNPHTRSRDLILSLCLFPPSFSSSSSYHAFLPSLPSPFSEILLSVTTVQRGWAEPENKVVVSICPPLNRYCNGLKRKK